MNFPDSFQVSRVTSELIEYVCQRIVDTIHPRQIVLFGSRARGEADHASDLDLMVVHDLPETDRQVRRQIEALFLKRRFGLDLIVRTAKEVERNLADGNPFYTHHIYARGIILYERDDLQYPGGDPR